jgi:hypothetical protein
MLKQDNLEFEASMDYFIRLCLKKTKITEREGRREEEKEGGRKRESKGRKEKILKYLKVLRRKGT